MDCYHLRILYWNKTYKTDKRTGIGQNHGRNQFPSPRHKWTWWQTGDGDSTNQPGLFRLTLVCWCNLCVTNPAGSYTIIQNKEKVFKNESFKVCILDNALFWKNHEGILLNCLIKEEADKVLKEFHAWDYGGHVYWKSTTDKILRAGFYWPTLFVDVKKFVTACHKCQIFEGKRKLLPLPLKPISTERPFQQWGLDFIGEIHPPSSGQHRWILTATDYFTKWIETIPCR